jgi:hypothetical protein
MASNSSSRAAKTATEALKVLWAERFFTGWKKFNLIEADLAKRGNHFTVPELGMALKRAKHLTRRGKQGSYEYIQKYPFAIEETPERKRPTAKKKNKP